MPDSSYYRKINVLILMLFLIMVRCSKPDEPLTGPLTGSNIVISRKSIATEPGDPYAIDNILRAYRNLQAADPSTPSEKIEPNNIYIRFLPANKSEMELLMNDTTLILFDHPLNHEVSEGELGGGNASSGKEQYDWQYCVVPAGKTLPAVHYEIIYEVFIPPSHVPVTKGSSAGHEMFYEKLVNESARITGNLTSSDTSIIMSLRSSNNKWTPKGRIRVWDDLLKMYIPLNHVNVHARWFTRVETALTDEDGNFQMKSFSHPVNYSIKWENTLFTIRDGLFLQAWYNGPKKKGDWMLDIAEGKSKMFATIHRAAYRHFYGDNLGLFRPTLRTGGRTKICYMDGEGTGKFIGDFSAGGIIPDIQVWGDGGKRATNALFATVAHELGHQLHSQFTGNIKFVQAAKIIRESWAEAVEWALTNDEYHKLGSKYGVSAAVNYDHQFNKHSGWPFVYDRDYSPIFIDLIDKINQRETRGIDHPNDLISQYSISFINNNLLQNSLDINTLRQEVARHKLEGVDDFKINELFMLY